MKNTTKISRNDKSIVVSQQTSHFVTTLQSVQITENNMKLIAEHRFENAIFFIIENSLLYKYIKLDKFMINFQHFFADKIVNIIDVKKTIFMKTFENFLFRFSEEIVSSKKQNKYNKTNRWWTNMKNITLKFDFKIDLKKNRKKI